jgi:hypothetical protein
MGGRVGMSKPVGVITKTKDNSRKLHANREEWMVAKKLGRGKQTWIWDIEPTIEDGVCTVGGIGHWEKI